MPGARRARSRACSVVNTRVSHYGHTGSPGIPRAMVLTVSFVLSPVIGLVCHRRLRIEACLHPVGPTCLRKLDAGVEASGPHDFTVRELHLSSARPVIAHRPYRPALPSRRTPNAAASTASRPASVTIAIRPSVGQDGEAYRFDLGQTGTGKFLEIGKFF